MAFLKPDLQKTYESVKKFVYDLFRQNIQEKNTILSPLSVYLTLAMAGCGADVTTKAEFIKVLGDNMSSFSADIINIFSVKEEDMNLSIANSAWIDRKFTVNETWTNTIKSLMGADVFLTELPSYETMNNINQIGRAHV